MKHNKFYEVQQSVNGRWISVGCFLSKANAEDHERKFNTRVRVYSLRVVERKFLDDLAKPKEDK